MTTPPDPTTTDPATEPDPVDPAADPAAEPDYKAEYERVKREARKHEDRAKANAAAARELATIKAASQTEAERAQAATKAAEDRAAALEQRAASADIRSTLVGLNYPPEHAAAVVEDMNVARYIGEDGQVDTAAVTAKYGPLAPSSGPRAPRANPAQGGGQPNRTLTEIIGDAEKNVTDRKTARESIALKSQRLLQQRNQG